MRSDKDVKNEVPAKDPEKEAMQEVAALETKVTGAISRLLSARRDLETAIRDLNEKYLVLGYSSVSMTIGDESK